MLIRTVSPQVNAEHQHQLSKLTREHEEKVLFLLTQMGDPQDSSAPRTPVRNIKQELENDQASALRHKLDFQEAEIKRLTEVSSKVQTPPFSCLNFSFSTVYVT